MDLPKIVTILFFLFFFGKIKKMGNKGKVYGKKY